MCIGFPKELCYCWLSWKFTSRNSKYYICCSFQRLYWN